ncbi:MAG TPA: hypothetical protein DDW81_04095, partial [Cryomorphaceae bacterium]|nr:hypothetical protein [Cryomorphaceae bacterium]
MRKKVGVSQLGHTVISLLRDVRERSVVSLVIMIFQGVTEGVGLLLIIPLLSIAGLSSSRSTGHELVDHVENWFHTLGIPVSLTGVLMIYVGILGAYALLNYYHSMNTAVIYQKVVQGWRNTIFRNLTHASWQNIQSLKNSDVQSALINESRKLGSLSNQLIQFTGAVILVVFYLVISGFISLELTLLTLFPLIVMFAISRPLNRKTYTLGQSSVRFNQRMQLIIQEHLAALKLVKSYRKETQHLDTFDQLSREVEKQSLLYTRANQISRLLFEIVAAVIIALFLYVSIGLLYTDYLELIVFIFIFARLYPKALKAANSFQQILNFLPAHETVVSLCQQMNPKENAPGGIGLTKDFTIDQEIRFQEVSFSYGDQVVLDRKSFSVYARQTNVMVGESGVGKSTTIDLI